MALSAWFARIETKVARGARWLDEVVPDWWKRIDVDNLDLSDGYECICGQLFREEGAARKESGYNYAWNSLFAQANAWITGLVKSLDPDATADEIEERRAKVAASLGFDNWDRRNHYSALQREWKKVIKSRQEVAIVEEI